MALQTLRAQGLYWTSPTVSLITSHPLCRVQLLRCEVPSMATAASRHLAALVKEERTLVLRLNRLKESTEWGMGKQWHAAFSRMVKRSTSGEWCTSRDSGVCV